MKVFFVIKDLATGKYLSVNNVLDDWNMCKEFEDEISALKEMIQFDGCFVIEKVYNP